MMVKTVCGRHPPGSIQCFTSCRFCVLSRCLSLTLLLYRAALDHHPSSPLTWSLSLKQISRPARPSPRPRRATTKEHSCDRMTNTLAVSYYYWMLVFMVWWYLERLQGREIILKHPPEVETGHGGEAQGQDRQKEAGLRESVKPKL